MLCAPCACWPNVQEGRPCETSPASSVNVCAALLLQAPKVQASKEAKAAAATASSKGKKKVLLRAGDVRPR